MNIIFILVFGGWALSAAILFIMHGKAILKLKDLMVQVHCREIERDQRLVELAEMVKELQAKGKVEPRILNDGWLQHLREGHPCIEKNFAANCCEPVKPEKETKCSLE